MQIPVGRNLGLATPQAAPNPGINARALDGGISQAVDNLGRTASFLGEQGMAQQFRDNQATLRANEQAMKEEVDARNAADRAKAAAITTTTSDALDDLQTTFANGISDGSIDKTKAAQDFRDQATKLVKDSLGDTPDIHRPLVENQLTQRALRLGNKVGQAVVKRDRSDTLADLTTSVEAAEREAVDDRQLGTQHGLAAIDAMATAGVPPAEIAKRKQAFTENVAYNTFLRATNFARTDNGQLKRVADAISADKSIDPTRQTQLLGTISGYQATNDTRAEAAAARAERQNEARLKRAEASFNVLSGLSLKGPIDPAFIDQTMKTVAGTPYAAGVQKLWEDSRTTGSMAVQPLATQQRMLEQVNTQIAQNGLTPELEKRRTQMQSVFNQAKSDIRDDGLRAAQERGMVQIQPIDMSSPQGIAAGLAARISQSQTASTWAGRPVSPLTNEESDQLLTMLNRLPAEQRSVAITTLAKQVDPTTGGALAEQMDKKDRGLALAFASAGDTTSVGRNSSELILKGQIAKKDGTSTKGAKAGADITASAWRADLASHLDGVFPSETTRKQVLDAAELISHGIAAEQGGQLSADDRRRALNIALGGSLVEHNGKNLPVPAGWTSDDLDTSLKNSGGPQVLQQAGNQPLRAGGIDMPAQQLIDKLPGQQLMFAGKNRYMVIVGGRPVTNQAGRPVIIEAK